MMSSRKELFYVISEMCDELRRKIDTDFEHVVIDGWSAGWCTFNKLEEGKDKHMAKSIDDDEDVERAGQWSNHCKAGFRFGIEQIRIETAYEKYKYLQILSLTSVAEKKITQLRTNFFWYDKFRPTWWKMNRVLKYARKVRVKQQAIAIEKDLAKMIPNRIDDILLGGKNAKT